MPSQSKVRVGINPDMKHLYWNKCPSYLLSINSRFLGLFLVNVEFCGPHLSKNQAIISNTLRPQRPLVLPNCPSLVSTVVCGLGRKQHFCNLPRRGVQGQRRRCRRHRCAIGLVHLVGRLLQLHTARSGGFRATALPHVRLGPAGRRAKDPSNHAGKGVMPQISPSIYMMKAMMY